MRFSVDSWDPSYDSGVELEALPQSEVQVDTTIEVSTAKWAPIPASQPDAQRRDLLFVDGVRRIDARVWIDDAATGVIEAGRSVAGICASYAAGVVCCCQHGAHLISSEVRRGLFTAAVTGTHIPIAGSTYVFHRVVAGSDVAVAAALSNAVQRALTDLEIVAAVQTRAAGSHGAVADNLLIIDGPLRDRAHLPRALGYVKTHQAQYLPPELNSVVAELETAARTPIFAIATGWQRYSWYLRLPCTPAGPWAGVVRLEAAPTLDLSEAVALANASQQLLARFASVEYKDSRAPQNLVPIAGLERQLRHRLGDASRLYREIRSAAPFIS
ncbi:hypothetical protein [Mycobacterium gastri]|uniref:NurA domain-containing protein n=1 Tax=Mycobacterium gastri TaxID=1777 RepID=A0A1X1W1F4_MYCGS|nr:hypothetical protein [Mycobacterium gastri]ETW25555.1 hypothetical protein MGAST_01970 [Mycobacterium gastri 'Wayne']ORV79889.1 hypothetical protein AWC07_22040 [Mycobacterium gastri]